MAFRLLWCAALAAASLLVSLPGHADTARVAVASNFGEVARVLAGKFHAQSGQDIGISTASTGKLYAQIHNGAPFDVLLAADDTTPRTLVAEGLADATSLHVYATGRLVLWSRQPDRVVDGEALLRGGDFNKLAIANPELAPYGAAAREVLRRLDRWDALRSRIVLGENVGQAAQFVFSGNAEVGLLPRSLVMTAERKVHGSSWLVPREWHAPIVQSAVLLMRARDNAAARGFLQYLRSDEARRVIRAHGYD